MLDYEGSVWIRIRRNVIRADCARIRIQHRVPVPIRIDVAILVGFDVVEMVSPAIQPAVVDAVVGDLRFGVRRLASRQLSRPEQIYPEGTTLCWDGKLRNGEPAGAGLYRLRVTVYGDGFEQETVSDVFELM